MTVGINIYVGTDKHEEMDKIRNVLKSKNIPFLSINSSLISINTKKGNKNSEWLECDLSYLISNVISSTETVSVQIRDNKMTITGNATSIERIVMEGMSDIYYEDENTIIFDINNVDMYEHFKKLKNTKEVTQEFTCNEIISKINDILEKKVTDLFFTVQGEYLMVKGNANKIVNTLSRIKLDNSIIELNERCFLIETDLKPFTNMKSSSTDKFESILKQGNKR
jgi:hypothetical protein